MFAKLWVHIKRECCKRLFRQMFGLDLPKAFGLAVLFFSTLFNFSYNFNNLSHIFDFVNNVTS